MEPDREGLLAEATELVPAVAPEPAPVPRCRRVGAAAGALAALAAASALLSQQRPLQRLGLDRIGLYHRTCEDTPGWANGFADCKHEELGDNRQYCTQWGWTCAGYEAKGLCGGPEGPKGFAMGPGLNSPEKNCCACEGWKPNATCDKDTGGTCHMGSCSGWRGAATCDSGRCVCPDGYCHGGAGTCQLDSRGSLRSGESDSGPTSYPKCTANTGASCAFLGQCHAYRGNTTCKMGMPPRCYCQEGYCADPAGMCYKDRGLLNAYVVPVNEREPTFPGQHAHMETALCVSGGGSRSMSAALGEFRALARLDLLKNIDVISCVSGGCWASSILEFAPMNLADLLGTGLPVAPKYHTLAELDLPPPALGAVLQNSTTKMALKLLRNKVPMRMLWLQVIGRCFLRPFGLFDLHSFLAPSEEAAKEIIQRNPQLSDAKFYWPQPGRAKTIIMNGVIEAPTGFKASADNAMSFQVSPDFTGSPFYPNNSAVSYENNQMGKPPLAKALTGGGFVESFAFGGPAPKKRKDQRGGLLQLLSPATPFSLAKAVGTSSCAYAGMATAFGAAGANLNPQVSLWPVTSADHPRPQVAMNHMIGDGGNLENTGILPVLQRGVKRIVAMLNSDIQTSTMADFCSDNPTYDVDGQITEMFAQLFGYNKKATQAFFNTHNQVFESKHFFPFACELQTLKKNGKPQLIRKKLTVVENTWWGIKGGWTVDIIFFLLDQAKEFEQQLPSDVQSALALGPAGGFYHWPNFKTMFQNGMDLTLYTPRQVNLLAAQTTWSLLSNSTELREVLAPAQTTR